MIITNSINIKSLDNFPCKIKQFKHLQAVKFMANTKGVFPLLCLQLFILKKTNLDKQQVQKIALQDAISILVYYRLLFDNYFPIIENPKILASDLFHTKETTPPDTIIIGDYRFNPHLTLQDAIVAEETAYSRGDNRFMSYYLIAMSCTKGFKEGWECIVELMDDSIGRGQIIHFNEAFGLVGEVKIDLLRESVIDDEIHRNISLITGKGGEALAIGFQGSNLFTFGL